MITEVRVKPKILLVDDEPDILETLTELLDCRFLFISFSPTKNLIFPGLISASTGVVMDTSLDEIKRNSFRNNPLSASKYDLPDLASNAKRAGSSSTFIFPTGVFSYIES